MANQKNAIDRFITKLFGRSDPPVLSGLHHALREVDGVPTRLHLRVEHDGSGILMANASAAAHLSAPGVVIAHGLLNGTDEETILKTLRKYFRGATKDTMQNDMQQVQTLLNRVTSPHMSYPMFNFDDFLASKSQLIAPLKADIPLAHPDVMVPLIDKLWEIGIPNMMILVPENPTPAHIVRAVERAEDLGMIAGVRGRANDLNSGTLLHDMAQAGIDYLTILYSSLQASVHDALYGKDDHAAATQLIEDAIANEVCPVVEVALVEATFETLEETVRTLQTMAINDVSFFGIYYPFEIPPVGKEPDGAKVGAMPERALPQVHTLIDELADELNMRCIWQPPVEYDTATSLASQVREGPRCSGDVSVRIETNGAVIPPRGTYRSAGNILNDSWDDIWADDAFTIYRESVEEDEIALFLGTHSSASTI